MGASGAGKSTLLNILACRIQYKEGGKLYANNFQYEYETFGEFANYVMQSDVLMQTMTVR
jgi:ABC-type lipoprotein export system ATPase subunit